MRIRGILKYPRRRPLNSNLSEKLFLEFSIPLKCGSQLHIGYWRYYQAIRKMVRQAISGGLCKLGISGMNIQKHTSIYNPGHGYSSPSRKELIQSAVVRTGNPFRCAKPIAAAGFALMGCLVWIRSRHSVSDTFSQRTVCPAVRCNS
jgi:hypothetical protein